MIILNPIATKPTEAGLLLLLYYMYLNYINECVFYYYIFSYDTIYIFFFGLSDGEIDFLGE